MAIVAVVVFIALVKEGNRQTRHASFNEVEGERLQFINSIAKGVADRVDCDEIARRVFDRIYPKHEY